MEQDSHILMFQVYHIVRRSSIYTLTVTTVYAYASLCTLKSPATDTTLLVDHPTPALFLPATVTV